MTTEKMMLIEYKSYLKTLPYEALLIEAVEVWGIEDAEANYTQEELIEVLAGRDEELHTRGYN